MSAIQQLLARIACDHLQVPTLEARNSDALDFHTVAVWGIKEALSAAYNAGATSHQSDASATDIHAVLDERHEVAVIWCVEDVQSLRPDLDEEESWHVLQRCRKVHDCNHGFTWDLIQYVADDLYPTKGEGDGQ